MKEFLNIGIAGYGMIGRVHGMNYGELPFLYPGSIPRPVLHSVCTSSPESAQAAAKEGGFASWTTQIDEMISNPEIDVIDVSLPNQFHKPIVLKALEAGKAVYCEKPLAGNISDARAIADAVRTGGGIFGMVFQYRFFPAIMKARELLSSGRIGRVFTWRAEYLHSGYQNPEKPMSWRMQKEEGGSGALGDPGSHIIDLVCHLLGEVESVQRQLETFIHERPISKGSTEKGAVTVDDVAWFRARMADGSVGTVEASRFATGTMDDLRIWIYGEKGALRFDLMDPSFLYYFDDSRPSGDFGGERGWQRFETAQYYPGAKTPPARAPIGWVRSHAENQYAFLKAVSEGQEPSPGIDDGLRTQLIIDAVERSADNEGAWTKIG
jgi:predicted dehydrogenase